MFNISSSHVRSFLKKEWDLIQLSVSFIFITGICILMAFVTLMFAGQMNQAHLAGVGLANTLYNIAITSVSGGYSSVFDTYGPQVHGSGKSNQGELGTVLLKCLMQGVLVHLVILGPYLNIVYIIDLLPGQEITETGQEDFRDIAVDYLRIVVVVEYLDYALMMISTYFAIQGYNKIMYVVSVVMIGSHILLNYVLVNVLQLGVVGLGLAAILGRLTPLAVSLTVCLIMVRRGQFAWNGFSVRALLGWKPMIKLGVSGAIYAFADIALFEISTFCSQFDGTNVLSVLIIVMQFMALEWSIAKGMSRAAATLIGTALGEEDADKTRSYMKLSVLNSAALSIVLAIISYWLKTYEVLIFSSDDGVKDLFVATFWVFCIGIPVDHIQIALNQGILVAFGAQKYTAWSMSIACYVIGLPIILVTIFRSDLKVSGIFIGVNIVNFIMIVTASLRIWMVDIEEEIENSKERVTGNKECMDITETEIHENSAFTTSYDANENTIQEETIKMETIREQETDNDDEGSDVNEFSPMIELEADEGGNNHVDLKEVRYVVLAFVTATVVCVSLAGVSFIRK